MSIPLVLDPLLAAVVPCDVCERHLCCPVCHDPVDPTATASEPWIHRCWTFGRRDDFRNRGWRAVWPENNSGLLGWYDRSPFQVHGLPGYHRPVVIVPAWVALAAGPLCRLACVRGKPEKIPDMLLAMASAALGSLRAIETRFSAAMLNPGLSGAECWNDLDEAARMLFW